MALQHLITALLPFLTSPQSPPAQAALEEFTKPKPTVGGLVMHTTDAADSERSSTLSDMILDYENGASLWIVAGQGHDTATGAHDLDLGLKYKKNGMLLRGTIDANNYKSGKGDLTTGLDWDIPLIKAETGFSLLGDVSTVKDGTRYTDFGLGGKITRDEHTGLFIVSNRGADNNSELRTAYMFTEKDLFVAFAADFGKGKTDFIYVMSEPHRRLWWTYDGDQKSVFLNNIFMFGNKPLPPYAQQGLFPDQVISNVRTPSDSDNDQFFPASFFVNPVDKIGGVFRINVLADTVHGDILGGIFHGAIMFRTGARTGWLATQHAKHGPRGTSYGLGVGYSINGITPGVSYMTGAEKILGLELSVKY